MAVVASRGKHKYHKCVEENTESFAGTACGTGDKFCRRIPDNLRKKKFLELISGECLDPHDSIFPTLGPPGVSIF
jgi:hypothetical protein